MARNRLVVFVGWMLASLLMSACTSNITPRDLQMGLELTEPAKSTAPAIAPLSQNNITGDTPKADVLFVRAVESTDGTWSFSVTVRHPDTGWENYADGWDVVTPTGEVLRSNDSDAFTRPLTHPHVEEQPFTRSQNGIHIPDGVTTIRVRAHSLIGGFGGQEVEAPLNHSQSTATFEVMRIESH